MTIDQPSTQTDPTSSSLVTFLVVFGRAVNDFDVTDPVADGVAGATVSAVRGGPASFEVDVNVPADGTVTLSIPPGAASDEAGNASAAPTVLDGAVTVDTTAPSVPTLTSPPASTPVVDLTPTFAWTPSSDADTVTYRLQVDRDGCAFPSPEIDRVGLTATTFTPDIALAEGQWCWRVLVTDAAGNQSISSTRVLLLSGGSPLVVVDYADRVGLKGGSAVASFGKPCVADLDADGLRDVVWGRHTKIPQDVYYGTQGGMFVSDTVTAWRVHDNHGCVVEDFDRDGDLDMFVPIGACSGVCDKRDSIWLQRSPRMFTEESIGYLGAPTKDRSRDAVPIDINRDGWMDVFVGASASPTGSHHRVLVNQGLVGGEWAGLRETATPFRPTRGVSFCGAVADLDGDGWSDVITCQSSGGMYLYRNNGGVLAFHGFQITGTVNGVHFAHLDNDDLIDMVLIRPTTMEVRHNRGNGRFDVVGFSAPLSSGWDATSPDIDGDGDRDLFVTQTVTNQLPQAIGAHQLWLNPGQSGSWTRVPVPQPTRGGGDKPQVFADFQGSGRDAVLVGNGGGAHWGSQGPRQVIAVAGLVLGDGTPSLSVSDVTLSEGNAGEKSAVFTVSLSDASASPVSVTVATADGTALAGQDYVAVGPTVLTMPAGQRSQQFSVRVTADTDTEPNEYFIVQLSNAVGAGIADGQGRAVITNDDGGPSISINDISVTEGRSGTTRLATFTVSLSAPATSKVTVKVTTTNGTATAGSDYVARSFVNVAILAGRTSATFSVTIKGDAASEPNEDFFVNLSGPSTGATLADARGRAVIVNDD